MNQEQMDTCERIESYLDGVLDEAETRRFEQDLLKADVAALFREVLLMRELLGELPPAEPPEGLVDRIEAALAVAPDPQKDSEIDALEETGGIWSAFKSGFRWPAYSLAGMPAGKEILKKSVSGMRTIGYALGPFQQPLQKGIASVSQTGKPLWKSAFKNVLKGVLS